LDFCNLGSFFFVLRNYLWFTFLATLSQLSSLFDIQKQQIINDEEQNLEQNQELEQKLRDVLRRVKEIQIVNDAELNDIGDQTDKFGDNPRVRVKAGRNQSYREDYPCMFGKGLELCLLHVVYFVMAKVLADRVV